MYILLQLTPPLGAGVGPNFNLVADVGVVVPSTATATQLLTGIIVQVLDTASIINIVPITGDCPESIVVELPLVPPTTTTTTSTIIPPPCNCIFLQNTLGQTGYVAYYDCNGHDSTVSILSNDSIQICGYGAKADTEGIIINTGGPCSFISDIYKCTECASEDGCYTYTVINATKEVPEDIDFTYIDCSGNEVTVTIPHPEPDTFNYGITICTCGPLGGGKKGPIKGEVLGPVKVGGGIPNGLLIELVSNSGCIVCKCYQIYNTNTTGEGLEYTYYDCNGKGPSTNYILPGEVQVQCAIEGSLVLDAGLVSSLTTNTCVIMVDTDVAPIGTPCEISKNQVCHTVQFIGAATIQYYQAEPIGGEYVMLKTLSGASTTLNVCAFTNSIVQTGGTGSIVITPSTTICHYDWECDPCHCITIYNPTEGDISVDYIDCDSGPTTDTISAGGNAVYCGQPPVEYNSQLTVLIGEVCPGKEYDCQPITTSTTSTTSTSTTTTSTTTTTTAVSYIYYTAKVFDGDFCAAVGPTYIIRSATLIMDNYVCISGTVYQVLSVTTGPLYTLTYVDNGSNSGNSCAPFDFVC